MKKIWATQLGKQVELALSELEQEHAVDVLLQDIPAADVRRRPEFEPESATTEEK